MEIKLTTYVKEFCIHILLICAARISNSIFPSAPPIRKLEDGSTFITLEPLPLQHDWQDYASSRNPAQSSSVTGNRLKAFF